MWHGQRGCGGLKAAWDTDVKSDQHYSLAELLFRESLHYPHVFVLVLTILLADYYVSVATWMNMTSLVFVSPVQTPYHLYAGPSN